MRKSTAFAGLFRQTDVPCLFRDRGRILSIYDIAAADFLQTHLVDQCIAGPTSEAMQLFSLRRRKSFQPSTTALRFVEDPRLHSCPYGSNGTQGTRKSLFLVLFYIYIGSGRESRPVLFPAGSQGLPLRYPFSQDHHAKLCGTCKYRCSAPLQIATHWQLPQISSRFP